MADVTDLTVSVIGAGMGGLAAALAFARKGFRRVDVYETASNLGFVGAGIQLAPNLVRVLDRWGCWTGTTLAAEATDVRFSSIRDGASGRELASVHMPDIAEKYGYPHCTGHRASLAGELYDACKREQAIHFHFATALVDVVSFGDGDGDSGSGHAKNKVVFRVQRRGEPETADIETDLLLGADGIKSTVRTALLRNLGGSNGDGVAAEVEDTGQAAYRIMLTREQMAGDAELLELLDADGAVRWIGEKRHIIAYPIGGKSIYNLSTCQPDVNFAAAPTATYTTRGSKEAMLRVYEDFCPLVQRMLRLVPEGEVCEWRLRSHKVLPAWSRGAVALLGDACHPTLPHLSQGAAMAIEDAAVVAEVISRAGAVAVTQGGGGGEHDYHENIAKALRIYELLRKDRTATLVDMAYTSGLALHLGEGEAKKARDRQFAEAARKRGGPVPDKWASPDVQAWIYSYDCVKDAQEKFDELFAELDGGGKEGEVPNTNGGDRVLDGQPQHEHVNGVVSTAA
ncbi:hypothetical protein SLS62_006505 [Diatrype stigma]|uniref:FAD-binding domain-containing protein n=1 Tax=Diatrype stigma TaxID=117547 RepID=A0AAN9USN4_9PEZI